VPRILIVEDEAHLAHGIRFNLEAEGYEAEVIADGHTAAERLTTGADPRVDLVLLDVMLPGLDGLEIARRAREAGNYAPILMLTARGQAEDVVEGLDAGADDYLPKPFDLHVLLARVKGLLRRRDWARARDGSEQVRIGEVEVDLGRFEVRRGEDVTRLTLLEAGLLKLLLEKEGRVVAKGEILERVWNVDPETETRAVDNFVLRLRRYIEEDPARPRHLQTVRGAGYRLELEPGE
jgi:DNA-binding response OmpR family regulator